MQGNSLNQKRTVRKRRPVIYIFLSVVLIVAAIGLSLSLFFKINKFVVTGSAMYSDSEIISASGIQEGENLFSFNKSEALRNILESFPYVAEVRVTRRPPGTLVITIIERESLALIANGVDHWLIDGTGRLLEQVSGRSVAGKPTVTGIVLLSPIAGTEAAVSRDYQDRLQALLMILEGFKQALLLNQVSAVDVSKTHELRICCEDGRFEVLLGDAADLDIKLSFMQASIGELPASARGILDVSCAASQKKASFIPLTSEPYAPPARPAEEPSPEEPVSE